MRKMLSLFMILLLCLGLLIGCTPKDDNAATLPEELENLKHYGPYDGWFLLIYPGQLQAVSYQEVAGFVFSSSSSFSMKAYKDGATYPLPDAYEQGIVPMEILEKAHRDHTAQMSVERLIWQQSKALSNFREISEAFAQVYGTELSTREGAENGIRYYGTYAGCQVISTTVSGGEMAEVTVAGKTFGGTEGFVMFVYHNGQLLTLQQAYDQDILQDADVERIDYWYQRYT